MDLIFLISLPRSGSTLLQRILMSHPDVNSVSEPWIMLPLVYAFKEKGIKAEYGHPTWISSFEHLKKQNPGFKSMVDVNIKAFANSIYSQLNKKNAKVFIDKTPRYYLIVEDLLRIFPEAKFVFLLRNPISVFASFIEAFKNNSIRRLDDFDKDFYSGPRLIVDAVKYTANRGIVVKYEDLVNNSEEEVGKLFNFIGIGNYKDAVTDFYKQTIDGAGDKFGIRKFKSLSDQSQKWKEIIDSPMRKRKAQIFLSKFDQQYSELGGYDLKKLIDDLNNLSFYNYRAKEILYSLEEELFRRGKKLYKDWV